MKSARFILSLIVLSTFGSCGHDSKTHVHHEHEEFKKEIEELKIKLEATEAQLLNVRSELANVTATKDTTQLP